MSPTTSMVLRTLGVLAALGLLVAGATLLHIAVVALRRSEGVFVPAGYVALSCLAGGIWLLRTLGRS